ncbi:hypothetical protein [Pseudoalteromonas rubra]|uniref:Uncharacterized protein n=1 Tax=Pseudoalteromonas rubra TaxID=43658 RepID=A0A0U3IFH9_9GAMM|nr:hypothetical protein [Pseudoalteromonas rubra]ALU42140.1 hypothetical protein AT705_03825 [Pseudoalteromonas rubra]
MTDISTIPLPEPINWDDTSSLAELHIAGLDGVFLENQLNLLWYLEALAEVCSETHIARRKDIAAFWQPYLYREPGYTLQSFFAQWLTYTPTPDNPGQYIECWDYLVNTESGLKLANDGYFRGWFRQFLNFHGDWINSTSSTGTLSAWMNYAGTE